MQGEETDGKVVFVIPPKESETNVWLLKKMWYGLGDVSRMWYNRVRFFLLTIGLKMSKGEPSIFYNNVLSYIISFIIFVDDFSWSGANDVETNYISELCKNFVIGKENNSVFQYLGLQLGENNSSITLDHMYYSETMKPIASNYDNSKDLLQSQIGKLLLVSGQTKLDITFDITNWAPTLNILVIKITNMPITSLHI